MPSSMSFSPFSWFRPLRMRSPFELFPRCYPPTVSGLSKRPSKDFHSLRANAFSANQRSPFPKTRRPSNPIWRAGPLSRPFPVCGSFLIRRGEKFQQFRPPRPENISVARFRSLLTSNDSPWNELDPSSLNFLSIWCTKDKEG